MKTGRGSCGSDDGASTQVHELNEAVATADFVRFADAMHPDAVWEHNLGSGSPEEGVYEGRERIARLFERIVEVWEYMRPSPREIDEVEDGVFLIHGELHCKHARHADRGRRRSTSSVSRSATAC